MPVAELEPRKRQHCGHIPAANPYPQDETEELAIERLEERNRREIAKLSERQKRQLPATLLLQSFEDVDP